MKKYKILLLAILSLSIAFESCEKDTEDKTFVENFPIITDNEGESLKTVYIGLGESFTPNISATLAGNDISSSVKISIHNDITDEDVDEIATDQPSIFTITYSADTETGITNYKLKQQVIVYDPTIETKISGKYIVDPSQTLSQDVGGRIEPKDDKTKFESLNKFFEVFATSGNIEIVLTEIVPGFYTISDAFFGWYDVVRGYGSQYSASGYLSLNGDNSITLVSQQNPWGMPIDPFSAKYDPETKSITFDYNFSGSVIVKGVMSLPSSGSDETSEENTEENTETEEPVIVNYSIILNANEGEGEPIEQNFKTGETSNLQPNTFTRDGYIFAGWNTKADGTGTSFDDEAEIKDWSNVEGAIFTLYAQWTVETPSN